MALVNDKQTVEWSETDKAFKSVDRNAFPSGLTIGGSPTLLNVYAGKKTHDFPSMAVGEIVTTDVTVTGVVYGKPTLQKLD